MAYPERDFFPGRRLVLAGGLAALALPATARRSFAGINPDLARGAMERFVLVKRPKPLANVEFQDANDKPLNLSKFRGKAVLLNFWATWCAPCVKEMPSLDRLQAALPKDRFIIVPLSIDGPTKPKVGPFYKDQKLSQLGIYFDKGRKAMQGLDVTLLPTSILVDPAGRELGRIEGDADWDMPESIELMKAAIAA
ncbi:TlpA disulfide reductase family protein [Reyranella sp.]|uniref:TlpA disulfide reductase family protein n=1 Tax=Reyranella sp. TaxID=1929291 RepID=UPI00120D60E9|nr:TlpA disulfide reductase family protein [Reyranella sp.]TAJ83312.1 MAG: TlpA family protein disulfide reductase [Reyranella sp.]